MKPIPLRRIDLAVGKPLPWAIYDQNQNLLLRAGQMIENHQQCKGLLKKGLFRLPKSAPAPTQGVMLAMPSASDDPGYDFDEMKLPVGSRLQLQITSEPNLERHFAKYLGHIKGVSLLVSTPLVDDKVLFMREGQTLILRAFTGKTAFGCNASVMRTCNAPIPYLHLSYPKQLQGVEIRSSKRLAVNLAATVQVLDGTDTASVDCLIVNVSPSGALIAATQAFGKIGDTIQVAFRIQLGPIDGEIKTQGIVRSLTPVVDAAHDHQPSIHHGVQFKQLQQPDILLLHSLAYQKLVDSSSEN